MNHKTACDSCETQYYQMTMSLILLFQRLNKDKNRKKLGLQTCSLCGSILIFPYQI